MLSLPGDIPMAQVLLTRPTTHPRLSHSIWTLNGPGRRRLVHFSLRVPGRSSLHSHTSLPPNPYILFFFFFYIKELKKKKKSLGQIKSSKEILLNIPKCWIAG